MSGKCKYSSPCTSKLLFILCNDLTPYITTLCILLDVSIYYNYLHSTQSTTREEHGRLQDVWMQVFSAEPHELTPHPMVPD